MKMRHIPIDFVLAPKSLGSRISTVPSPQLRVRRVQKMTTWPNPYGLTVFIVTVTFSSRKARHSVAGAKLQPLSLHWLTRSCAVIWTGAILRRWRWSRIRRGGKNCLLGYGRRWQIHSWSWWSMGQVATADIFIQLSSFCLSIVLCVFRNGLVMKILSP